MSRFQHWKGERAFIFNQATHLQGPAFKLDYFEQRVLTAIKAMPETVGLLGLGLMWGVKAGPSKPLYRIAPHNNAQIFHPTDLLPES
jgi:hypothetical protein